MDRRIFIRVATPAVIIGLLVLGVCLVSTWYITRLQKNLSTVMERHVGSLRAAQELEIRVRQLRWHTFLNLLDPSEYRLKRIEQDHQAVEEFLAQAKKSSNTPAEEECVREIADAYEKYRKELVNLPKEIVPGQSPRTYAKLMDKHPILDVIDPCHRLLRLNTDEMADTARKDVDLGRQVRIALFVLGFLGPASGLIIGYGVARGLSRSIYELSVRVQDVAERLDQDVTSVKIAADGDMQNMDQQLRHIVVRVGEVVERLQRQQRDMVRAEQLSAVGQLAAGVAHEIRNPLTSVKMLIEVALRSQNRKPLTMDDLTVIHREIDRLEHTIQGFLDFARVPKPQRATCDLRSVIDRAVELVRARSRQQQVEIAVRGPESPLRAEVDRDQIGTVLVNLFLNALDAMPQGGRLDVTLERSSGSAVRIDVADTGKGISPEIIGRLFTPFASTKPTGTGLGLSISRRIIEEHGGQLTAVNLPEGGARFRITLPVSIPSQEKTTPAIYPEGVKVS